MTYETKRLVELSNMSNMEIFDEYRCALLERHGAYYRNRFGNGPTEEILNLEEDVAIIEKFLAVRGFDIAYARRRAADIEYEFASHMVEEFGVDSEDEEMAELYDDYWYLKNYDESSF